MTDRPNSLSRRDAAVVLHPVTNLSAHERDGAVVIREGKGIYIYDDAGKEYIEGVAGLWCTTLGWGQKRLADAARTAMERLSYYHMFAGRSHDVGIELAEKLLEMSPVPMSKVFFANSGSEANDTAVKLVWAYNHILGRPKKRKFVSLMGGYHGSTVVSTSLTGLPRNQKGFGLPLDGFLHADSPHYYRHAQDGESETAFVARLGENLEQLILKEGPDTVAAFIAEPVQGVGGIIVPPVGYFEVVQEILRRHDILFLADEVVCGFGRTGNMFGTETFKLQPDMITLAKGLSSAYQPISALLVAERVYQAIVRHSDKVGAFAHGFTYSGHPVPSAVALETLRIYEEEDIVGHVRRVAPRLLSGLEALKDHPLVGEVRGIGLMAAVELVADKASKTPFPTEVGAGALLAKHCEEHGLVLRNLGDSLAFSPPLIITEDEIDLLLDRFGNALNDTASVLARNAA